MSQRESPASDWLALLLLIALVVALRFSALDNPYYWDEAGAYVAPSLEVSRIGVWRALPGCHESGLLHGHPPVLYLIHGSLFRLFGASPVPHHLVALCFAALGVWYTFRTGKLLGGRSTGISAAALLLFAPMFFAQAPMVLGDLPVASLGIACAYYLLTRQRLAYAVAATVMLQTKETALATSVALALYWFLAEPRERDWRSIAMHAVPIASLVAFFAIEYVATGTFVQAPYFARRPLFVFDLSDPAGALASIAHQSMRAAQMLFFREGRFLLTALIALGLVLARPARRTSFILLALVAAVYLGAFSLINFLPRYFMTVLPFLCLAAAWSAFEIARERAVWQYGMTTAVVVVFVSFFYVSWSASGNFETNLQYERVIAATKRVSEYVESRYASRDVVTNWPMSLYLTVPELGYVTSAGPSRAEIEQGAHARALIYSSLNPAARMEELRRRWQNGGGELALRIDEPEIVIEVYERR